jgi:hypothetical protein
MKSYPLFRKENIPAYFAVMAAWAVITGASAAALVTMGDPLSLVKALVWAAATTMAGMAIMFGASVINLRKLVPGFRRLAEGRREPQIPPVWCPVLTAATNAAMELASKLSKQETK